MSAQKGAGTMKHRRLLSIRPHHALMVFLRIQKRHVCFWKQTELSENTKDLNLPVLQRLLLLAIIPRAVTAVVLLL